MSPIMWWILVFLSLATRAVSRCECGYSVRSSEHESPLLFTDAIESDFTKTRKLGPDYGWIPQQFNVTAKDGRGRFGKTFLPENVVVNPDGAGTTTEDDGGLELVVGREMSQDAISGAEIDSKRLDLHWGSFRAGMKVTDVNGTCAAFFWVSSLQPVAERLEVARNQG
jgi:hypothetical protein